MKKAALISVTDKSGIVEFAQGLISLGYTILSSSGTASLLKEHGLAVTLVEEYTGQAEILDGRVKTLHPKIHAGILAKRSDENHIAELERGEILPIELVVVNLYPFLEKVIGPDGCDPVAMVNFIDIGGPAMLRGAAKNHQGVLPVIDPNDYEDIVAHLSKGEVPIELRRKLASKVFTTLANYDLQIGSYYARAAESEENLGSVDYLGPTSGLVLSRVQELRYGENPHQKAHLYRDVQNLNKEVSWQQLQGKSLSYNNLLDFDAALRVIRDLKNSQTAVIIKHLNPCGVGRGSDLLSALQKAKKGDPRSHFGGVVAFSHEVTKEVASELTEGFVEIVLAPSYSEEALTSFSKRKNIRVIKVALDAVEPGYEIRVIQDGVLIQERDRSIVSPRQGKVVSKRQPSEQEWKALELAWTVCSHVKSNAIVAASPDMVLGVGAGQMSRVDSAELLVSRAKLHGNSLAGGVAASDAFFPFPDSAEYLIGAGVTSIVAPNGATRDDEVIKAVDALNASLIFVGERHFRH